MQPNTLRHLRDVLRHANFAKELDSSKVGAENTDPVVAFAAERVLSIIGEAVTRIRDEEPIVLESISGWREIIRMRNRIIHSYERIDPVVVQDTLVNGIPLLIAEVEQLLGDQAP